MSAVQETGKHERRSRLIFAGIAIALFLGMVWLLKAKETEALVLPQDWKAHLDPNDRLRPLAQFAEAVQTLKLVTVAVDDVMTVEEHHEHPWRGNVDVSFQVPLRYLYGVDLSGIRAERFALLPGAKSFRVTIPRPSRLSTEVITEKMTNLKQDVGWLRFKGRAGNYVLTEAFKNSRENAERRVLSTPMRNEVEQKTLEAVHRAVSKFAEQAGGQDYAVTVEYDE